jgi:hypothetical protein
MELNNLVGSMLQDYAYILKGTVYCINADEAVSEIIIKIPLEIQTEFEKSCYKGGLSMLSTYELFCNFTPECAYT